MPLDSNLTMCPSPYVIKCARAFVLNAHIYSGDHDQFICDQAQTGEGAFYLYNLLNAPRLFSSNAPIYLFYKSVCMHLGSNWIMHPSPYILNVPVLCYRNVPGIYS